MRESSLSDETEGALLVRFIASMYAANMYLLDPRNAHCAINAIASELGVTADVAALEYASATNTVSGEISPGGNFTVNQEGIMNDVQVRREFGGFGNVPAGFDFAEALVPGAGKLIDYSVRDAAVEFFNSNGTVLVGNCSVSTVLRRHRA